MEWLNPRAFWLLPLIALLFLFARRRALDERWVGNLYLWAKNAPPDPSQLAVRRLRRHWLIALQAAFMLAVIAALAHPVSSSTARHATFIVDVSASMGARDGSTTRLALARDRAIATAAALPRTSMVRVFAAGPAPIDRGESAAAGAGLAAILASLAPTAGPAAIVDAINAVRARDGANADIYVFTDEPAPAAMTIDAAHWLRVGHAADNLAITALSAARLPSDPSSVQVLVTVRNFGSAPRSSGLDLVRDAEVIAHESITVAPGASQSVTMTFRDSQAASRNATERRGFTPAVAAGFENPALHGTPATPVAAAGFENPALHHTPARPVAEAGFENPALHHTPARPVAAAGLENPALHETLHARLTKDDALAVDNERWALIPSNTPLRVRLLTHGSAFLETALAADASLAVETARPVDLDAAAADAREADVVVCDGCRSLPARGSALLVIPTAPSEPPRTLDSLSLSGTSHPVTQGIDLSGLAARVLPRVARASDGDVLARAADAPAIIATDRNGRRVVELNLDLASSTLPLSVSFPLLLANATKWLSARRERVLPVVAGDPLLWPLSEAPAKASAIGPDGRSVPVRASADALIASDTLVAGLYVMNAGSATRAFVVNPATESESDLSMTGETATPGAPLSVADPVIAANTSVAWPSILLIAALLLLAIEWRHFCRGAR